MKRCSPSWVRITFPTYRSGWVNSDSTWGEVIASRRWNCGSASVSLVYRHSPFKEGSPNLVTLRDMSMLILSETSFCRFAPDVGELEASRRREQPRSRQIWNPSPGRESSATHDGERTGRKLLVSSRWTIEPGVPQSGTWWVKLMMPAQPAQGECRHKCKKYITYVQPESPSSIVMSTAFQVWPHPPHPVVYGELSGTVTFEG